MAVPPSPPASSATSEAAPVAPFARHHVAPVGIGESARSRPVRSLARDAAHESVRRRRDLEIAATTVVGMAAVLAVGPAAWIVALLLVAATVFGTFRLLSAVDSPAADQGVPIEGLIVPAVTAFGGGSAIHLVPLGPALVPALLAIAVLLDRALAVEVRITGASDVPSEADRSASLITMLLVALVAFAGVAALVPGGLAGLQPAGAPIAPLPIGNLAVLVLADAAIAGLLGYRAVALRTANARDALLAAVGYAVAIAIGAAAVRAIGLPRLVGPAVLMFLFYLWDTLHSAPPSRRRDPRWLWETAILVALGLAVVLWNLRLGT